MNNISLNGESLILKPNISYVAIDSLYLKEVCKGAENLETGNLSDQIREKIFPFPYTDIPFAEFVISDGVFNIKNIIKADYDTIDFSEKKKYFASDTGLLIIIKFDLIKSFSINFSYEELVDTELDGINLKYWHKITSPLESEDIGLIMAPGFDSGYEFDGGGVYYIKTKTFSAESK